MLSGIIFCLLRQTDHPARNSVLASSHDLSRTAVLPRSRAPLREAGGRAGEGRSGKVPPTYIAIASTRSLYVIHACAREHISTGVRGELFSLGDE